MDACIFCEILAGRLPASLVYQDELCTAFMDIRPVTPGHLLVIPNHHSACLAELPAQTGAHIFQVGQLLASAMRHSGLRCEGINFFLADGQVAGQEVFHTHLHVLPRFTGDGFGFRFPPGYPAIQEREILDHQVLMITKSLTNIET
jgi:histidine triad (HIT) family protein